jgi:hypothetical protein
MPFLAGPRRLATRAVKGAVCAFIGAQRRPLTGEAGGLGAGFGRKGRRFQKRSWKLDSHSSCLATDGMTDVLCNRNYRPPQRGASLGGTAREEGKKVCA